MMKREYIQPEACPIDVEVGQSLLAGSIAGEIVFTDDADAELPTLAPDLLDDLVLGIGAE